MTPAGHKKGDVRADGKVFYGQQKTKSGRYYDVWRDPWYAVKMLERRLRRREIKREYDTKYRNKKGESRLATKRAYYLKTRDRDRPMWNQRATLNRWRNPDVSRAAVARRRALRKSATPTDANASMMREVYSMAARVSECLGIKFHVDHIKPLSRGGLHHHANLQVLPGRTNIVKSDSENFTFIPL